MRCARPSPDGSKPRQAAAKDRSPQSGFTLVEVLAAFVILALMTVALQSGVTAAASGIAAARARVGAEAVATSLASGPIAQPPGGAGQTTGTLNGYDWTIELDVLQHDRFVEGPQPDANAPWLPVQMRVSVRRAGGGPVLSALETIRLLHVQP